MDMMHTQFVASLLSLDKGTETPVSFFQNSLIYDARNLLASQAMDNDFDRVLWLDSDVAFDADMLNRLHADMDEGRELVCGLYFKRRQPIEPCIYKAVYSTTEEDGKIMPHADPFFDYPQDSIFEIAACGFGAVLTSVDLLRRVYKDCGLPFSPQIGFGEDLSFCKRCEALGVKMYCDSRIKVGHIGYTIFSEETFMGAGKTAPASEG